MSRLNGLAAVELIGAIADKHGCIWNHFPDSRRALGERGFPDLVIAGRGGTLYREIKAAGDKVTADQWRWAGYLVSGGQNWAVWRPADLSSGRIENEIAAIEKGHNE